MHYLFLNYSNGYETFLSCLTFHIDNLLIDYQFTFSLIQEDDNHYTAINFMASPEQVTISEKVLSQQQRQGHRHLLSIQALPLFNDNDH